jgi:hypothetical protein
MGEMKAPLVSMSLLALKLFPSFHLVTLKMEAEEIFISSPVTKALT